jgi:GMP synthase-like glutamine amidotransferase
VTIAMRFERLAGVPCLLQHFSRVDGDILDRLGVHTVILSGHSTIIDHYDPASLAPLLALIRDWQGPLLGLCGGHQLIGLALGVTPTPMGPLPPGAVDPWPSMGPGMRKEWGPCRIDILRDDPLFAGLGDAAVVEERHFWELTSLPEGWVRLASSEACAIQAMRLEARPFYGVQFHPERYTEAHPDGRVILGNFFRLAGLGPSRGVEAELARPAR